MNKQLTDRQTEVLEFLKEYFIENGYYPSRAELAKGMEFSSPNGADSHLKALSKKGAIVLIPDIARGIRIPKSKGIPIISIDNWLPDKNNKDAEFNSFNYDSICR